MQSENRFLCSKPLCREGDGVSPRASPLDPLWMLKLAARRKAGMPAAARPRAQADSTLCPAKEHYAGQRMPETVVSTGIAGTDVRVRVSFLGLLSGFGSELGSTIGYVCTAIRAAHPRLGCVVLQVRSRADAELQHIADA